MSIYHCHFQIVGRSGGRSSTAAAAYCSGSVVAGAAYRAGEKIYNQYDGVTHDYTKKTGVVYSEIILPGNAPEEFKDRSTLWNAVEMKNNRRDSQLARECDIALPTEFTREEQINVVKDYVSVNFVNKGICADISIHDKEDGNPHVHIMLTMNDVSEKGFGARRKEEQGRGYFLRGQRIKEWRESWAKVCNIKFKEKGLDKRIDHRTLEAQGIDREPTIHEGRSKIRAAINQEIKRENERNKPAAIAEYMRGLYESYDEIDKYFQELPTKRREADKLDRLIKDMKQRKVEIAEKQMELNEAKEERAGLKFWQKEEKKKVDDKIYRLETTISNARSYFARNFEVKTNEADDKIQKLSATSAELHKELRLEQADELIENKYRFELEYQKQWLLAKIRPDGKEILSLVKSSRLDKITTDNFNKILQDVTAAQAKLLIDRFGEQKEEKIKDNRRIYDRSR